MEPPRLKNDCFALPPGVHWTPVADALAHLRDNLGPVTAVEQVPLDAANGRYLAQDALAMRSHPPAANSAVDGYGFAHSALKPGPQILELVEGRAAAGDPFAGALPSGSAIRILTGAILPDGVDTVVLEEDVRLHGGQISFEMGLKQGANARAAGEDLTAGDVAVPEGTRLRGPELALLAATGCAQVSVRRPLRIGVLSTGDEIVSPGNAVGLAQTYDANRPMLLAQISDWGFEPVDLGHVRDDRALLRTRLDQAVQVADVILTSGGASAGDEDHVSAILTESGSRALWRIAIKPGRPLALGLWQGVPIFGLPGNPVAAMVCTLVFGAPAFAVLAGGAWRAPIGFQVPAEFVKTKKPGRREYLRARLTASGSAEVFASEGSGRVSGLSWADGLVELEDGARSIAKGDFVTYYPYQSFAP